MSTKAEKIVDFFPFPTISPIVGEPTYETICELHNKLNSNAASVHSNLGCGTLGHLVLTVSPTVYSTLSATAFIVPVNPGSEPVPSRNASRDTVSDARYSYSKKKEAFDIYIATDKALRQLLLASVDEMFIRSLRHKYIGYGNVTTREILDHLYSAYASITSSNLQANDVQMKTPYDANQPIETLILQIESAVEFADAGQSPYTSVQVVNAAYELFI